MIAVCVIDSLKYYNISYVQRVREREIGDSMVDSSTWHVTLLVSESGDT